MTTLFSNVSREWSRTPCHFLLHLHPRWQLLRLTLMCSNVERKNLFTVWTSIFWEAKANGDYSISTFKDRFDQDLSRQGQPAWGWLWVQFAQGRHVRSSTRLGLSRVPRAVKSSVGFSHLHNPSFQFLLHTSYVYIFIVVCCKMFSAYNSVFGMDWSLWRDTLIHPFYEVLVFWKAEISNMFLTHYRLSIATAKYCTLSCYDNL